MTRDDVKAAILNRSPDDPARRFLEDYAKRGQAQPEQAKPIEHVSVEVGWYCRQCGREFDLPGKPHRNSTGCCPFCGSLDIGLARNRPPAGPTTKGGVQPSAPAAIEPPAQRGAILVASLRKSEPPKPAIPRQTDDEFFAQIENSRDAGATALDEEPF